MAQLGRIAFRMVVGCIAAIAIGQAQVHAADLIDCDFTGTAPGTHLPWTATRQIAAGVGFSGWSVGPGAHGEGAIDDALGFRVDGPADPASTLEQAIIDGEYLSCTLTPPAGGALDLDGRAVSFAIQRRSWHSPRQYAVFCDFGEVNSPQMLFQTPYLDSSDQAVHAFRFFTPLAGHAAVAKPVTFRIYAFGANYNHPTSLNSFAIRDYAGKIDALTLDANGSGTLTATPDAGLLAEGTTVTIMATPAAGWHFAGFAGDIPAGAERANPVRLVMAGDAAVSGHFEQNHEATMKIGMNLGSPVDWSTDWPFLDGALKFRGWISGNADGSGAWDTGLAGAAPLDAQGYPTQVPYTPADEAPQILHSILFLPARAATYRFEWRGIGRLRLRVGSANYELTGTSDTLHEKTFAFDGAAGQTLDLLVRASGPAGGHVRDLHLWRADTEGLRGQTMFDPVFTERLRPFTCLRFMDWAHTNASPMSDWDARPKPDDFPQTLAGGVAIEPMLALCNQLHQDAWICIPHQADDRWVRETARLVRDRLAPGLRAYVEYSNETWNSAGPFSQTQWVQDQGQALGLDPDRWRAGQMFVVRRSVEIWRIFEQEIADPARVVKVLATQGANTYLTEMRVAALNDAAINPTQTAPDALAIAPYFGHVYQPGEISGGNYPTVDSVVTTEALAQIENARQWTRAQKAICDRQGWRLICYEGGQHFVGGGGAENDDTLTQILTDANRDPRMGERYTEYLTMLQEEGVDLFCNFSYIGAWSKWGSWGVLETQDQPETAAPKYRAITDWIDAHASRSAALALWRAYAGV